VPVQPQARLLFGRERELAEADAALATSASGTPCSLLVGGDAGIGKTSLVAEVTIRAQHLDFSVLTGHCLDIDTGVPLDPVREALRPALSGRSETLPPVCRRLAPFVVLDAGATAESPSSVFDDMRLAVAELTRQAPVLLVLEDLQWADRSTQDFALALARTMSGRLLFLLTYRAEALTRAHPFRRVLVEILRAPGARPLDLEPLADDAVAALVRARDADADEHTVRAILDRSEGNPLYAEELLADPATGTLPGALSDLLADRIDALRPQTRALIRLASANGSRIDSALLAEAAGLPIAQVEARLHEAIDANVVTSAGGRLAFRHGLLRDAAYGHLLPDELTRVHAATADALQGQLEADDAEPSYVTLGKLAFHRHAAGQVPEAFAASVRAGLASRWFGASESLEHLERALGLWDRVPNAEELGGLAKPDLLRLLAETAEWHGEFDRADRYILAAVDDLEEGDDPLVASRVYASYGAHYKEFRDGLDQRKALELAVTYAEGAPSQELAKALTALALWQYGRLPVTPTIELANRAVEVAAAAGCEPEHVEALWLLGMTEFFTGRCWQGIDRIRRAAHVAEQAGLIGFGLEVLGELSVYLSDFGQQEQGIALAVDARGRALERGLTTAAQFNGEQVVERFLLTGRLDEAERLLEQLRAEGLQEHRWRYLRTDQLLARGDLDGALALEQETIARVESGVDEHLLDVVRQVDLFSAAGRIADVLPIVDAHLEERVRTDSPLVLAVAARSGYTALATAARAGVTPPPELPGRAEDALGRAMQALADGWATTTHAAHGLLAAAVARNLDGDPAVEEWRAAEHAAATHGEYFVLKPRLALAEALLGTGDRDTGHQLILDVWQSARRMGAGWFEREAARVARRHRIRVPGSEDEPRPLASLTPREREVLDILATGATNRTIAERLVVTETTASVHVTNILSKLGVSNRGQAAALARDLLDPD
jgi:DNA-binding CsgD family transcriptional regulator/phosphoglycolate phosphatase-like HAD superfamily hydrolase